MMSSAPVFRSSFSIIISHDTFMVLQIYRMESRNRTLGKIGCLVIKVKQQFTSLQMRCCKSGQVVGFR